jgi:hypothetical protein
MVFVLPPMFFLQQNRRTRGWNGFCPEARGWGGGTRYTYVNKCKNDKIKRERKKKDALLNQIHEF